MNKAELTETVAKELNWSKTQSEKAVNTVLTSIKKGLKKDKTVQLVGFGTFTVRTRAKRTGRNPRTGETITIPAKKTIGFKAGKDFKKYI